MYRSLRQDEGFSIAEVVIAASILFFVLTAMIGVVGASQTMSVMAKDKNTLTNGTAEYIDKIRALDFQMIDSPPSGLVPLSEIVTYAGQEIEFTTRVVMSDGAGGAFLRTVYLRAVSTIRGRTFTTSAVVHIKNPNNDTTASTVEDPDAPTVWFTNNATPENTVVFSDRAWFSVDAPTKPIELEAKAESSGDTIASIDFSGGGVFVPGTFSPGASVTRSCAWDTTSILDGIHKIAVKATDSQSRFGTADRQFIVDNIAPASPGAPQASQQSATETRMRFAAAADPVPPSGQNPVTFATSYGLELRQSTASGGGAETWPVSWSSTQLAGSSLMDALFNAGPIARVVPTESFSRYRLRAVAYSPRMLASDPTDLFFISPPNTYSAAPQLSTCTTEYVRSGSKHTTTYDVTLYLEKPKFPVTSVTYTFHAKPSGGAWTQFMPTGSPTVTEDGAYTKISFTYTKPTTAEQLWFRVGLNVTPADGAGPSSVLSQAIGLSPVDSNRNANTPVTAALMEQSWEQ
jgi:hypothetical protein